MKTERSPQMLIFSYDLERIVSSEHELRKIAKVVDFVKIARKFVELKTTVGRRLDVGIKCVFL